MNLKAEHVDAYRTGHPFSMSIIGGVSDHPFVPSVGGVAYACGVLAWINHEPSEHIGRSVSRSIETLDLRTNLRRHLVAEDRASFHTIAISSTIIAALDHAGRCHVWDMSHSDRICLLRLPSAGYNRMEASGPALAIASSGQDTDEKIEVFTWSFQSRKTQFFLLPLQPLQSGFGHEWKITLDPRGESLFLFQRVFKKHVFAKRGISDFQPEQQDGFYFTRASLDGQMCALGQYKCPSSMCRATPTRRYSAKNFRSVEVNGSATLWLFHSTRHGPYDKAARETESSEIIRICFNFEESSFKVEVRKFAGAEFYHTNSLNISIWKDIMYWGDSMDTDTRIVDFRESTCEKTQLEPEIDFREDDDEYLFLGDETFLIKLSSNGWKVWCFDKNIRMANGDLQWGSRRWSIEAEANTASSATSPWPSPA